MARPLFRWEHFPERMLRRLAETAGLPRATAAAALGERHGVPPGEEFVREAWPVLLEVWLKADRASAAVLAAQLREKGLGDRGNPGTSAAAIMRYLRTCNNSQSLRGVVLAVFLAAGASPTSAAAVAPRRQPSRRKAGQEFRVHVEGLVRELLGVEELTVEPDGAIPLRRGSTLSFLRTVDDPEQVQIHSPLVVGAPRTPELLEALNDLNAEIGFSRIFATPAGDVILALDLRGPEVRADDLAFALGVHGHLADTLDHDLQGRFGGRLMLPETAEDSVHV